MRSDEQHNGASCCTVLVGQEALLVAQADWAYPQTPIRLVSTGPDPKVSIESFPRYLHTLTMVLDYLHRRGAFWMDQGMEFTTEFDNKEQRL